MQLHRTPSLFAWDRLQDSPELAVVREFFRRLPDERLLRALETARGHGRNDYPVQTLWFCVLLQPLLRRPTMEQTLGELRRNADLRQLGGMEHAGQVPRAWNISRFVRQLGQPPYRQLMQEVFAALIRSLGEAVGDLGEHVAGDSTHLSARPGRSAVQRRQPQPDGGHKEYVDEQGAVVRVLEWFGYKLHLLCDARHEVALAYTVTPASTADNQALPELVRQAKANLPAGRIKTLAYDRACDDEGVHRLLNAERIAPVIQTRQLWREEPERVLEGLGVGNIVYDEAGTIYCYDMISNPPVKHPMAYIGHEPRRGTLKYRCPAMHEGWACPGAERCNKGRRYGLTVRVKRELDLRRFPPIPRATKTFERRYRGRTATERVAGRLKVFWGADDGNVAGGASFLAKVGLVLIVHAGLATLLASSRRRPKGSWGRMRLGVVERALRENTT